MSDPGEITAERKYASQLQILADIIIGGTNVPAPFSEIKRKLIEMKLDLANSERDYKQLATHHNQHCTCNNIY